MISLNCQSKMHRLSVTILTWGLIVWIALAHPTNMVLGSWQHQPVVTDKAVLQYHSRVVSLNQTGTILITTRLPGKIRLSDIEARVEFDPKYLSLESCRNVPSSSSFGSCVPMDSDGQVTLNWHSNSGQVGEFALWLINLRAIAVSNEPVRLDLKINRALDTEQNQIDYQIFPGTITILSDAGTGGLPEKDTIQIQPGESVPLIPNTGNKEQPETAILHLTTLGRPFHEKYPFVARVTLTSIGAVDPAYEFSVTTSDGYLALNGIQSGTYDVRVKGSNTLQIFLPGQTMPSQSGVIELEPLILGDVDDNNYITAADFSVLAANYNQCTNLSNINPNADLNADGCISAVDFSMLIGNYMKVGSP